MSERFGILPDGRAVTRHVLGTGALTLGVLDLGATVQSLLVTDGTGPGVPVVLGFGRAEGYAAAADDCFGGVAGRFANRIRGGDLELDGARHRLSTNDRGHTLHGGADGFHRRLWEVVAADESHVALSLTSPAGDQGFPGRLQVHVAYTVRGDEVRIDYTAETDATTVVNLTNHAYFNLAGAGSGSAEGHELTIAADAVTLTDADQIPTGELAPVEGTPFDFREAHPIGVRLRSSHPQLVVAHGYDHNFVLRGEGLRPAATLRDPGSGRTLEVLTDPGAPALHRELPRRAARRDRGHDLPAGGRHRPGDAALPGLPAPPGLPVHGAASRRAVHQHDRVAAQRSLTAAVQR